MIDPKQYKGEQIILSSGRLVFNAREESILLFAKEDIGFSTNNSIHFNVGPSGSKDKKYQVIVNAPKIQLGLNSTEPLLKGNETVKQMKEVLNAIKGFSDSLSTAIGTGIGIVALTSINIAAVTLSTRMTRLISNLENTKSKQNFTL